MSSSSTANSSASGGGTGRGRRMLRTLVGATIATASLALAVTPASAQVAGGSTTGAGGTGQPVVVQGIVGAVHADPTDTRSQAYLDTLVTDERDPSRSVAVTFPRDLADRYGGIDGLVDMRVAVTAVPQTRGSDKGQLTAVAVDVQGNAAQGLGLAIPPAAGGTSKPALTALCRFPDKPAVVQTQAYFQGLTGANGMMDSYFRQTSYQQVNLLGSKVAPAAGPWYVLPSAQAAYLTPEKKMDLGKLLTDCSALAAADFDLNDFAVINLALNSDLVNYSFGGGLQGRRVTWLTPKGWKTGGTTAHEMGHAFRMVHTGLASAYDNAWDVMSGSGKACTPNTTYVCMPQHQSAYNKLAAGWLTNRVIEIPEQPKTTVELAPMDNPGSGKVLARITPTDPDAHHAYLVEYRRPVGLDANLPFDGATGAVLIYEYWETPKWSTPEPGDVVKHIQLMGKDGKSGARWLPGMVFDREQMFTGNTCDMEGNCVISPIEEAWDYELDGIRIRVDSITSAKATVTFTQLDA